MKIFTFTPELAYGLHLFPSTLISFSFSNMLETNSNVRAKTSLGQLKVNSLNIMLPFFPARNAGFLLKCIPLMMVHWQNLPKVKET